MKDCRKLNILLGVYRYDDKPNQVLISFNQDFTIEQKRVIYSETVPVSTASIKESLLKIVTQLVDRSVFGEGETNGSSEKTKAD